MVRRIRQCASCQCRYVSLSSSTKTTTEGNNKCSACTAELRSEVPPLKRAKVAEADADAAVLEVCDDSSEASSSSSLGGSEAGDDCHCTQLYPEEEEDGDDDEEEDHDNQQVHYENHSLSASVVTNATVVTDTTNRRPPNHHNNNDNGDICFICGSSLARIKSRLDHIKRCSKKHGVTAHELRLNDDTEIFTNHNKVIHSTTSNITINSEKQASTIVNPYLKTPKNNTDTTKWHADASKDLDLAESTTVAPTTIPLVYSTSSMENKASNNKPTSSSSLQPPKNKQTTLSNFFKVPLRSLNNVLLANAKRVAKTAEINANYKQQQQQQQGNSSGKNKGRWGRQRQSYAKRNCPAYKRITGTDFVCDGFMYAKSTLTRNYFLTHFHSDHYGGIDSSWNAGTIYCSVVTANLVHQQLGVSKEYLHPLAMNNAPHVIESNGRPINVTLIDANHCPGAVMFLFQVGKKNILHVGDFRWHREHMLSSSPPLKAFSLQQKPLDELFLDTTYCGEKHTLPTQDITIQAAVEVAVKEVEEARRNNEKILMLFGAYTIGKERIYLSVAQKLGCKVYVDTQRFRVLSALEWAPEQLAVLTTKKDESNLWVVPMAHLNMKKMPEYIHGLSKAKNPTRSYDKVIGFRPTGWSNTPGNSVVTTRRSGKLVVHSVPYSEHSSFTELVDCIQCLKPKRIIPTVAVSKSEQQVDLLLRAAKLRQTRIA